MVVNGGHGLSREVVESPLLGVVRKWVDVALRAWVGIAQGLDSMFLEVFSTLNDPEVKPAKISSKGS